MLRELVKEDYYKGFLDLINYFTKIPKEINYIDFCNCFSKINDSFILVIEKEGRIIGTGKLLLEQKFHNNFSKTGHIEDVVILEKFRGNGYGSLLIKKLIQLGKENECYKIVLNCKEENVNYYKKIGFIKKGKEMGLYI